MIYDIDSEAKECVNKLFYDNVIGENITWNHSRPWPEVAAETIAKYMRAAAEAATRR